MSEQADSAALRFGLAQALALQSQWQEAMDQLLEVIRIERKFRDDAARKAMIAIFELCGDAALVSAYRRKLSASLY
jgi:putative thioredoxin